MTIALVFFLVALSLVLTVWQWVAARRFPIRQRPPESSFHPDITVFKPLKGADHETEQCLRSWFEQNYPGRLQILFGVASIEDPAVQIVQKLLSAYADIDARLIHCRENLGPNAKVSSLIQMEQEARHPIFVVSDSDVRVSPDFLRDLVPCLARPDTGLANCFYGLANPSNLAMQWEALAVNADFWSQVLQGNSIRPMDFALGAVMALKREALDKIGGFSALVEYLADDYQLGNRIARAGYRIELASIVAECWSNPMNWTEVWKHQLRWARTIRVCQPAPYFFSILSNAALWPLLCLGLARSPAAATLGLAALLARLITSADNQTRLLNSRRHWATVWMAPVKDLLQAGIWALSFLGNRVVWRGQEYIVEHGGKLRPVNHRDA